MAKKYAQAVSDYNQEKTTTLLLGGVAIINGIDNPGLAIVLALLWGLKVLQVKDSYNNIANSKEYLELSSIYHDIILSLIGNMDNLKLNTLQEKYLYIRYLIDNNYLSINQADESAINLKYKKNEVSSALSLNGYGLPSSNALLLRDVIRSHRISSDIVAVKMVGDKSNLADLEETNNIPKESEEITTKEKISSYFKDKIYLTAAEENGYLYFLNPNEREVFRELDDKHHFLKSDKGRIVRVINAKKSTYKFFRFGEPCKSKDLLEEEEYILKTLEANKNIMDKLKEDITPNLEKADKIVRTLSF